VITIVMATLIGGRALGTVGKFHRDQGHNDGGLDEGKAVG
jgi:hypothetical protein